MELESRKRRTHRVEIAYLRLDKPFIEAGTAGCAYGHTDHGAETLIQRLMQAGNNLKERRSDSCVNRFQWGRHCSQAEGSLIIQRQLIPRPKLPIWLLTSRPGVHFNMRKLVFVIANFQHIDRIGRPMC